MYNVKIQNIVATASIADELDLTSITRVLPGSEYDRAKFPGLIYRQKKPKTALLLFRTGKVVCTSAKTVEDVMDKRLWDLPLIEENGDLFHVFTILNSRDHIWVIDNMKTKKLIEVITQHDILQNNEGPFSTSIISRFFTFFTNRCSYHSCHSGQSSTYLCSMWKNTETHGNYYHNRNDSNL